MTAALAAGVLVAAAVYLLLQRGLLRVIIGFVLLGHAANIILVAAGGMGLRGAPLLDGADRDEMADPLPQAFVLTAIVITFGLTVYLLALARSGGDDDPGPEARDPDGPDTPGVRDAAAPQDGVGPQDDVGPRDGTGPRDGIGPATDAEAGGGPEDRRDER